MQTLFDNHYCIENNVKEPFDCEAAPTIGDQKVPKFAQTTESPALIAIKLSNSQHAVEPNVLPLEDVHEISALLNEPVPLSPAISPVVASPASSTSDPTIHFNDLLPIPTLFPDPTLTHAANGQEPYFSYDLDFQQLPPSLQTVNHHELCSLYIPEALDFEVHQPPVKRQKLASNLGAQAMSSSTPSNRPRMRNFLCPHPGCMKTFADNAHLRDHMFVHTGEKSLRCPECDKCFARVTSLRSHRRVHTGERPFICLEDGCGKRYASRAALRMHTSLHAKQMPPPPAGKLSPVKKRQKKTAKITALKPLINCSHDDKECLKGRCRRMSEKIKEQRQVILDLQAQLATTQRTSPTKPTKKKTSKAGTKRSKQQLASLTPMVAPLHLLQDGIKPFQCMLGCGRTFSNYFQLAFHAKQHPGHDPRTVLGDQLPFPVGPKYCPVEGCEFSEQGGKCMKTLQIVKRHWQRVHQNDRPFLCPDCPPSHAPKAFKTKDNLTAHRKECRKRSHVKVFDNVMPVSPTLVVQ
ncbi:unnamed protein product [Aphanomyces euteiches]